MDKWIPVSERLPEERDWYLGISKSQIRDGLTHYPLSVIMSEKKRRQLQKSIGFYEDLQTEKIGIVTIILILNV